MDYIYSMNDISALKVLELIYDDCIIVFMEKITILTINYQCFNIHTRIFEQKYLKIQKKKRLQSVRRVRFLQCFFLMLVEAIPTCSGSTHSKTTSGCGVVLRT